VAILKARIAHCIRWAEPSMERRVAAKNHFDGVPLNG